MILANLILGLGLSHIKVKGSYHMPPAGTSPINGTWQVTASLSGVDPRLLYSTLAHASVSGSVVASQKTPYAIAFDAKLNMASGANVPQFGVSHLTTHGSFVMGSHVQLDAVSVQSADAQVNGHATYGLRTGAVTGAMTFTAPGIKADATMHNFAADLGTVKVVLHITSVDSAARWLRTHGFAKEEVVPFLEKVDLMSTRLRALHK